ncbi:hypothetical protein AB0C34_17085 [Nocardia sp. NPDC049220]|uniref:hypothetical protein n=1 Tax=Nocardia sp. NPDC049220 TaxID=3155273 RepID=UPI0033C423E1
MATDETGVPRRTIRIPDEEWNAGMAAAARNGETLSAVIRRAITSYAMEQAADTTEYHTEYRATSKLDLNGAPRRRHQPCRRHRHSPPALPSRQMAPRGTCRLALSSEQTAPVTAGPVTTSLDSERRP